MPRKWLLPPLEGVDTKRLFQCCLNSRKNLRPGPAWLYKCEQVTSAVWASVSPSRKKRALLDYHVMSFPGEHSVVSACQKCHPVPEIPKETGCDHTTCDKPGTSAHQGGLEEGCPTPACRCREAAGRRGGVWGVTHPDGEGASGQMGSSRVCMWRGEGSPGVLDPKVRLRQ